jgi:ketosteroid isomerase-like protein
VHFWTFNDLGQITRYRHFNDTAAELEAWRA